MAGAAPDAASEVVTYRPRLQPLLGWIEFPVLLVFALVFIAAVTGPSGFVIFAPLSVPFALLGPVTARSQVRIDAEGVSIKVNVRSRDVRWDEIRRIDGRVLTLTSGDLAVVPTYPRRVPPSATPRTAIEAVSEAWRAARR